MVFWRTSATCSGCSAGSTRPGVPPRQRSKRWPTITTRSRCSSDVRADQGRVEDALALARRHVRRGPASRESRAGGPAARAARAQRGGLALRSRSSKPVRAPRARAPTTPIASSRCHLADEGGDPGGRTAVRGARAPPAPGTCSRWKPMPGRSIATHGTAKRARRSSKRSRSACATRASSITRARSRARRAIRRMHAAGWRPLPRRFRARSGRGSRARSSPRSSRLPGVACSRSRLPRRSWSA